MLQTSYVFAANFEKTGLLMLPPLLRMRWGINCITVYLLLPVFKPSHPDAAVSTCIHLYFLQGNQSSKVSIFQFSPCSLGSSTISLPFLWQKNPRSRLVSTSYLQGGKITFAHILKRWVKGTRCIHWNHFRLILNWCFHSVNTYEPFTLKPSWICCQTNTHHHNIYWVATLEIRLRRVARISML